MKKLILSFFAFLFFVGTGMSQTSIVKGRVVDSNSSDVIENVAISIKASTFNTMTDPQGLFVIQGDALPQGEQVLLVSKPGYYTQRIQLTIQNGATLNLSTILLEVDLSVTESQIGIISLSDNELDEDDGSSFNTSGLLQASRDAFLNAAAFDFSATFFRPRGLDNANGKVLINGLEMNKQITGRPQWGNWGGLNDVQRNREFSMGLKASDYTFGDVAGTTNIIMRASQYRQGGRVSYASSNRSYRGRVMGTYNSGLNKNGWAYAFSAARRFGEGGYQDGTIYDSNSFFASVEKKINDNHSLNLTAFYTPNRRGRSTAITQEQRDLKGIRYNPNWGYQDGEIRNSRIREIEEPIFMLNHYWNIGEKTTLNTNIGYQTGTINNSRIDNNGNRNPAGNYYQRLPSYFLRDASPTPYQYQQAYLAREEFVNDGQIPWNTLYDANIDSQGNALRASYILQDDVSKDTQVQFSSILFSELTSNITLNAAVNYRSLKSENYAQVRDLLGSSGFLDIDTFANSESGDGSGDLQTNIAQSDVRNPNRIVGEGDRYKYNFDINADVSSGFVQAQFKYSKVDFYLAASLGATNYQRNGLYENGNYQGGNNSFGESEALNFSTLGFKGGAVYKLTGRHLLDINAGYLTKAPSIRNSFSNSRQNNNVVEGLVEEKIQNLDLSYIFRSPILKARVTGFYNTMQDQTDINFFFTESIQSADGGGTFVQEVLTGIASRRAGAEIGIEAQVTPTIKLKGAASMAQYVFTNNPNQYFTSDDFEGPKRLGDGTTKMKNLHIAGGPENAFQLGFEYRDPNFWWFGVTSNYFSNAYIDVSSLRRNDNFATDTDNIGYNDYDPTIARELLQQEQFNDYTLVNVVGGKSWRVDGYYIGFFATINNVFDQRYRTGGFEDSRIADYRGMVEESNRETPVFGNRYFFGNGTTYYLNLYVRF